MDVVGEGFDPVVDLSAAHIAGAQNSTDLVGCDHFPIFGWDFRSTVRDMEIT